MEFKDWLEELKQPTKDPYYYSNALKYHIEILELINSTTQKEAALKLNISQPKLSTLQNLLRAYYNEQGMYDALDDISMKLDTLQQSFEKSPSELQRQDYIRYFEGSMEGNKQRLLDKLSEQRPSIELCYQLERLTHASED